MLASEFLQNIVFINLQLSDQEKIERFIALSNLYNQVKQAVWYILYGIHIFFFPFAIFGSCFLVSVTKIIALQFALSQVLFYKE